MSKWSHSRTYGMETGIYGSYIVASCHKPDISKKEEKKNTL